MNYLAKENVQEVLTLSPLQESILAAERPSPDLPIELEQISCFLEGRPETAAFQAAWDHVVQAHPALRTIFRTVKNRTVQVVLKTRPIPVLFQDLCNLSLNDQQAAGEAVKLAHREPFNPAEGPLVRLALLRLAEGRTLLISTHHRAALDLESQKLVLSDLLASYAALQRGEPLSAIERQPFRDYLTWLARQDWGPMQALWAEHLAGVESPTLLPLERPALEAPVAGRLSRQAALPLEASSALTGLASAHGVSPDVIAQAAWAALLSVYSGESDVVFGTGAPRRPEDLPGSAGIVGPFFQRLPVRVQVDGSEGLPDLLKRLEAFRAGSSRCAHIALTDLRRAAQLPEGAPLFQSVVEVHTPRPELSRYPALAMTRMEVQAVVPEPLILRVIPGAPWEISCEFAADVFGADAIEPLLAAFCTLLEEMARRPDATLSELELLSESERRRIMVEFNQTEPGRPLDPLFHDVFADQVAANPNAIAATCGTEQITYGELNARSNQMAHWLRKQGFGRDDLAALFADRSIAMLVAIIAVAKAGGAYVPLDPDHPDVRLEGILTTSQARVVLTQDRYLLRSLILATAVATGPALLCLDEAVSAPQVPDARLIRTLETTDLPSISEPGDLANVFFTSGSTGVPKGAMVEHIGMINHLWAKIDLLKMDQRSVVAQNSSHCFDISVWQFLAPLMVGGRVAIYENEVAMNPQELLAAVKRDGVTILEVVPTMLDMLVQVASGMPAEERELPCLQYLFSTGEALPVALCRRWLLLYPGAPVVNGYGATECSDDTTHEVIAEPPPADQNYMSVGRPIPNFHIYILDRWMRPVPVGCPGEIYFTSVGVGRGYLNEPERTAAAFLQNPFADGMGSRMYRTGDLGRYLPDGRIVFMRRIDHQVKVRGYRIELGEIEAAMLRYPAVAQSVVVVRPDETGTSRLLGYVMAGAALSVSDLTEFLKTQLPEYMVPEHIMLMDAFPLNSNGKIDRPKLPNPGNLSAQGQRYVAPRDRMEMDLVRIWEQVLNVQPIGVHDNFFELGGHSMKAVFLMSTIHGQLGIQLPLAALFKAPTVAGLREQIGREETAESGCLRLMQEGDGTCPPLFLVHPGGGSVMSYSALVSLLGPEKRVYGIVPLGFDSDDEPLTTVESMADLYVEQMRAAWPQGPYRMAGWSFGGIVAFEIARRLEALDQRVEFLGVLDTPFYSAQNDPAEPESPESTRAFLIRHFGGDLGLSESDFTDLTHDELLEKILVRARELGLMPQQADLRTARRITRVSDTCRRAAEAYHCTQPIASDITLFRATQLHQKGGSKLLDPEQWRSWSTGELRVFDVPGDHHTMVEPPHVQGLAEAIRRALGC